MRSSIWDDFRMYVLHSGNVLNKLLAINIGVFIIMGLLWVIDALFVFNLGIREGLEYYLSFPADPVQFLWRPWSIVTYQFVHRGFWHILYNVIVFMLAGRIFREFLGDTKLLNTYLLGGAAGAVVFALAMNLLPLFTSLKLDYTVVGASASVLAILVAAGTLVPDYTISLILIGPVKLKYIVLVFLVLDLLSLAGPNAGGHFAHLGGAIWGYVYIRQLQNGNDMGAWLTRFINWVGNLFRKKPAMKARYGGGTATRSRGATAANKISQEEVDAILDKIAKSGYDSLSQREKDILFKASKDN